MKERLETRELGQGERERGEAVRPGEARPGQGFQMGIRPSRGKLIFGQAQVPSVHTKTLFTQVFLHRTPSSVLNILYLLPNIDISWFSISRTICSCSSLNHASCKVDLL